MQLTYRGQHYTFNASALLTKNSEMIAKYRGATYQIQQPIETIIQPTVELKYRGVTYLSPSGKSLGKVAHPSWRPVIA